MTNSTDELVSNISKPKKSKKAPFIERVTKWVDYQLLPYIGVGIMVAGTTDSAISRVQQLNNLPQMVQGAVVVVALAFVFSRAFRFFGNQRTKK